MNALLPLGLLSFSLACATAMAGQVTSHNGSPAQRGVQPQTGAPFGELRDGAACVSFFADIRPGRELKIKATGKGRNKRRHFFFQGSEVTVFPQPAEVSIALSAHCRAAGHNLQPIWPEFVKHLEFVFRWDFLSTGQQIPKEQEVKPIATDTQNSAWTEDKPTKTLLFTLRAEGVSLDTHLVVDVYAEGQLLKTFVLFL